MAGLLGSCTTSPPVDPSSGYRERLWAEIGPLPETFEEFLSPPTPYHSPSQRYRGPLGPESLRYLQTYELAQESEFPPSGYFRLGLLQDQDPILGVLVGVPNLDPRQESTGESARGSASESARGTVFLVHGYLDHVGSWAPVIKKILQVGFILVALDLPGHGFSGGVRGDIEDFSQYGEAVRRVAEWAEKGGFPRPWIAMGHSTGAAAIWMALLREAMERNPKTMEGNTKAMERVLKPQERDGRPFQADGTQPVPTSTLRDCTFECVLFLAPLVRSAHWRLSMFLVSLTRWAIPYWKSRTAEDPLFPIPYFPVHWAEKLKEWEKTVKEYPVLPQKGWIFQGTRDEVVDHSYSIPFLRSKLPGFQVRYIEGASHVPYLKSPAEVRFIQEVIETLRMLEKDVYSS